MSETVLDASAILALLQGERGSENVLQALPGAVVSSVNLSEVVAKLADHGMPTDEIRQALTLGLEIVPFTEDLAYAAGELRLLTRDRGLSLGDRACLALAKALSRPVLTADRAWARLDLGIEVRLTRP